MAKSNPLKTFHDAFDKRKAGLKKAQDGVQLDKANFKTPDAWDVANKAAGRVPSFDRSQEDYKAQNAMGLYQTYKAPGEQGDFNTRKTAAPVVTATPAIKSNPLKRMNTTSTPIGNTTQVNTASVPNVTGDKRRILATIGASKKGGQTKYGDGGPKKEEYAGVKKSDPEYNKKVSAGKKAGYMIDQPGAYKQNLTDTAQVTYMKPMSINPNTGGYKKSGGATKSKKKK